MKECKFCNSPVDVIKIVDVLTNEKINICKNCYKLRGEKWTKP